MRVIIQHVSKGFRSLRGNILALKDISLAIESREFFVLLGPSGSGKSTLLNLISGLEKPTQGKIWFDERLVASGPKGVHLPPKDRNVAFVFQSYALYPHLSVFENIAFPLKISGLKKENIKKAVQSTAYALEISDLLHVKPSELSGGQRQRVAIARAIVRHPNIFLLDEPLSNLDPQLRLSMRTELKNLQRKLGVTTIYVTHDQTEAMSLGDRIAVLRNGNIEQTGTPDELYEKPQNQFVAAFIGWPSMNIIKIRLIQKSGIFWFMIGETRLRMPENKLKDLKGLKSNEYILGIRPEHIHITYKRTEQSLDVKIISIESYGRDRVIIVSKNGQRLSILSTDKGLKEGDTVAIEFDLQKALVFNN